MGASAVTARFGEVGAKLGKRAAHEDKNSAQTTKHGVRLPSRSRFRDQACPTAGLLAWAPDARKGF